MLKSGKQVTRDGFKSIKLFTRDGNVKLVVPMSTPGCRIISHEGYRFSSMIPLFKNLGDRVSPSVVKTTLRTTIVIESDREFDDACRAFETKRRPDSSFLKDLRARVFRKIDKRPELLDVLSVTDSLCFIDSKKAASDYKLCPWHTFSRRHPRIMIALHKGKRRYEIVALLRTVKNTILFAHMATGPEMRLAWHAFETHLFPFDRRSASIVALFGNMREIVPNFSASRSDKDRMATYKKWLLG